MCTCVYVCTVATRICVRCGHVTDRCFHYVDAFSCTRTHVCFFFHSTWPDTCFYKLKFFIFYMLSTLLYMMYLMCFFDPELCKVIPFLLLIINDVRCCEKVLWKKLKHISRLLSTRALKRAIPIRFAHKTFAQEWHWLFDRHLLHPFASHKRSITADRAVCLTY